MDLAKDKNRLDGSAGDDILRGNGISDTIQSNGGNDQLWGGLQGDDSLIGGSGSNGYWWGANDGNDTIQSLNGTDALIFYQDPAAGHQAYYSGGNLVIYYNTANKLSVKNWQNTLASQRLQNFVWNDGGILTDYLWNAGSNAKGDLSAASMAVNNVHRLICMDGGSNVLIGSAGDDYLESQSGSNQLWGGTGGNDQLVGSGDSNGFWWGANDGNDTIVSRGSTDAVVFYQDAAAGHSGFYRNNADLVVCYNAASQLTLQNWVNTAASRRIQNFVWTENNGRTDYVWNAGASAVGDLSSASLANNNIHRIVSVENAGAILRGSSGSDVIQGGNGNDQLWGGVGGRDVLEGGAGADTYWCGTDNTTEILNDANNSQDTLYLYNLKKSDISVTISGYDVIINNRSTSITIDGGVYNTIGKVRFSDGTTEAGSQLLNGAFTKQKAFVLSVSRYASNQSDLTTRYGSEAVNPEFAQSLSNHYWAVSGIYDRDATQSASAAALKNFAYSINSGDDVMLLISSHGGNLLDSSGNVRSDGQNVEVYGGRLGINFGEWNYKNLVDIAPTFDLLSSRAGSSGHVTILMETCHSGATSNYIWEKGYRNMTVMTSSDYDEESLQEGYHTSDKEPTHKGFVSYTEQALSGLADANLDGYVSTTELYQYTASRMNAYSTKSHVQMYDGSNGSYKYRYLT